MFSITLLNNSLPPSMEVLSIKVDVPYNDKYDTNACNNVKVFIKVSI